MTPRIKIQLNCGHGRLVHPQSDEAIDILNTDTAACDQHPRSWGEAPYFGVQMASLNRLYIRMTGLSFDEYVRYFGQSIRHEYERKEAAR